MSEFSESSDSASTLGFTTLSALVVANMIGAGVFTSSGFALAALGNPGRVMFAWVLCGAWAVAGAIAYGGLVARLPKSGGEYLFLSRFVHPSVGIPGGMDLIYRRIHSADFSSGTKRCNLPCVRAWIKTPGSYRSSPAA